MRILLLYTFMNVPGTEAASDYLKVDLPNAALDVDFEGDIRVVIGVVHVRVALLLEPLGVDVAEAAFGLGPHADFAGKHYRCLPDPALYAGVEVPGVITCEVHRRLPCPHLESQPRQRKTIQVQSTLPCAHLYTEVGRHLVVEAHIPLVAGVATQAD